MRCAVVSGAARVIRGKLTHYRQFSLIDEVREKIKAPDPGVVGQFQTNEPRTTRMTRNRIRAPSR